MGDGVTRRSGNQGVVPHAGNEQYRVLLRMKRGCDGRVGGMDGVVDGAVHTGLIAQEPGVGHLCARRLHAPGTERNVRVRAAELGRIIRHRAVSINYPGTDGRHGRHKDAQPCGSCRNGTVGGVGCAYGRIEGGRPPSLRDAHHSRGD
eukprot:scaffold89454_cov87-Phaeocystis_antarctica.AAC.1